MKMKCPNCKGNLRKGIAKEYIFGVYLGNFPAIICDKCNDSFTDSGTTRKIQEIAKKKGVFGLSAKSKITKTGNSLTVRIPKKLADHLKLKSGVEVYVHPDKDKIIVELC